MKKLEIVLRTCDIRQVHNDWRVRYCNIPKDELIKGCLKSLIKSCEAIEGIKLTILDDHSSDNTVDSIKNLLLSSNLLHEFIPLDNQGYNYSSYMQFLKCKESEYELTYSVEDDYLHCPSAIKEMLDSYVIFSERIKNKFIVIHPFDNPEVYNPPANPDFVVHGSARHWRTGSHCTATLFSTPDLFKNFWPLFETFALKYNGNYLEPRVEHFDEYNTIIPIWKNGAAVRFNPIPSLALHMQFKEQCDPFIDWQSWWKNYAS